MCELCLHFALFHVSFRPFLILTQSTDLSLSFCKLESLQLDSLTIPFFAWPSGNCLSLVLVPLHVITAPWL